MKLCLSFLKIVRFSLDLFIILCYNYTVFELKGKELCDVIGNVKVIAVCMCKVYDDRNYNFIKALNKFAVENDYRLFIYHTCSDLYWKTLSEKGEQSVFDLIDYNITDAVVTFEEGVYAEDTMTQIRKTAAEHGKPVLSVGVQHDDCVSVKFGYAKGFEQIVRHVIEKHGVRDIGFIAGRKGEENSEERIAVFRKVLKEYGIPFRNDVFYYGDYWSAPTLKAVSDMIEENKVPRAIICANDMMAIVAGAEFQRRGYKIPEDIIITGFDGLEEARYCTPMLTTSGCNYDDTAKTIINVISKVLAGEKTETIYTEDYHLSVENSCGCEPTIEQINTGEHIRMLRDRMNRYQDEERVLYELTVNIMNCETPKTLAALLKECTFGDMAVVVNGDFFDERKDPRVSNREKLFDDKMILVRSVAVKDKDLPMPFDRSSIIPSIDNVVDYGVPLIFSALSYVGIPLGYVCFYFPITLSEYFKIPLYVNSLNTALGSYRSVVYQKYMTKHIEEMYRHDMLTGLYNRTGFYNALEALPRRNGQLALVVSVDVDGLKYINDNFGHEAGDYAIRAAANAIDSVSIENKVCGRFGGDELALFAIVDTDLSKQVKQEIKDKMAELNRRCGKSYVLSASIGVAVAPVENFWFDDVMHIADKYMYEDKRLKPHNRI